MEVTLREQDPLPQNSVENASPPARGTATFLPHTQPPVCWIPAIKPVEVGFLSSRFTSLASPLLRHGLQAGLPDSSRQCIQTTALRGGFRALSPFPGPCQVSELTDARAQTPLRVG